MTGKQHNAELTGHKRHKGTLMNINHKHLGEKTTEQVRADKQPRSECWHTDETERMKTQVSEADTIIQW